MDLIWQSLVPMVIPTDSAEKQALRSPNVFLMPKTLKVKQVPIDQTKIV